METNRRSIFGIILVILGAYFLFRNLDLLPFELPWYFFEWQMILIVLGVINLFTGNRRSAAILLGIGVFFFIPEFYPQVGIENFWPIILIIVGFSFFLRNRRSLSSTKTEDSLVDDFTIFGGNKKSMSSKEFKGGKITTIFGGTEINLREASPSPGGATLDLFTMFGGTDITVPDDWTVESKIVPVLGGYDDRRGSPTNAPEKRLVITGIVLFGGVEVKS